MNKKNKKNIYVHYEYLKIISFSLVPKSELILEALFIYGILDGNRLAEPISLKFYNWFEFRDFLLLDWLLFLG